MADVTSEVRQKTETLPGGRFPMPDKQHARLALQMLPRAKEMPSGGREKVRVRAERMLGRGGKR